MSNVATSSPPEREFGPGFLQLAIKINNTHRGAVAGDAHAGEICAAFLAEVKDKLGDRFPPFIERCCPEIGIAGAEARVAERSAPTRRRPQPRLAPRPSRSSRWRLSTQ